MITTIDNNSRVFLIVRKGFFTRSYVCNLEQIPEILTKELEKNDEYTIKEIFNFKLQKCSKKHLNSMFKANQIDFSL